MTNSAMWDAALRVLRANDVGGWTLPAPRLYPHQWSWDSAFIAIGLAHVDPDRALRELETLFAAQWADGRVPHIVYNPAAPPNAYFPDAARWACAELSPSPPRAPATSGLAQPPVHALAAWRICEITAGHDDVGAGLAPPVLTPPSRRGGPAGGASPAPTDRATVSDPGLRTRLRALYPRLFAWHRYLATARDPETTGLITIYHPWESGTDNSPRWDAPLENVTVGAVPPYTRRDLQHVAAASHRPTDAEYDRYLWLIESLKLARYDDAVVHRAHPFLVKDVLSSAILAAANHALARLADWLGAPDAEREQIATWSRRFETGVLGRWDPSVRLALDLDVRTGRPIRVSTVAGLAPLLVMELEAGLAEALVERLFGPDFAGAPGLAFAVAPSTTPGTTGFSSRTYWRGPAWPFANWLLWWALRRHGYRDRAAALRAANLALLDRPDARFAEYFEPFTAEPLGSLDQSWTAAVALDWLAADGPE